MSKDIKNNDNPQGYPAPNVTNGHKQTKDPKGLDNCSPTVGAGGLISNALLDKLLEEAAASPRLRMNMDLRNGPEDGSQRMLNGLMPGTGVPIHRHRASSETVVVLRGSVTEIFYDERGVECGRYELRSPLTPAASPLTPAAGEYQKVPYGDNNCTPIVGAGGLALQIPKGMWHTIVVHEPSVIMEVKDGAYAPPTSEDVWNYD